MKDKIIPLIKRFPILSILAGTYLLIWASQILTMDKYDYTTYNAANVIMESSLSAAILFLFLALPVLLTLANVITTISIPENPINKKKFKRIEYVTVLLGTLYSLMAVRMAPDRWTAADWQTVLINNQKHTPILRQAFPTIVFFSVCGIIGYLILSLCKLSRLAPLVIVLAIAAMYIGIAECLLWIVQIFDFDPREMIMCLMPFNCIIIATKTICCKMQEWKEENEERDFSGKSPLLAQMNQKLCHAAYWPFAAFLLMWPLLGIGIAILALFGQQPDSLLRAWTETSDWRLSQKTSPQNLHVDEHYLCTVAAGGHPSIVKPLRMGERHGHRVIVNRQLCIANAFEQIIEEKTPSFHRHIRHFYDTYGFPIARKIHSPYTADFIYFLMKPLEWIFLIVIYLCDPKPENRIARQYLPLPIILLSCTAES